MADRPDQRASGSVDQFVREGLLLLFILEFVELDLDQFVLAKSLIGGPDDPVRDPFLSNEDDRLQVVGKAPQILLLKSLQRFHDRSPVATPPRGVRLTAFLSIDVIRARRIQLVLSQDGSIAASSLPG